MIAPSEAGNLAFKKRKGLKKNDRVPDPTPLEIARRSALIRSTWDEETRRKRAGEEVDDTEARLPMIDMGRTSY